MANMPRYANPSEYGGDDDRVRTPDGLPRPLTTKERAQVLRQAGIRDIAEFTPGEPFELGERVD